MSWTIAGKYVRASATDPDAQAYLQAVEAVDGQALEFEVARAIDNFVLGCKADGIWSAIKASCILAGARTLAGALQPLVGTAPTSFNFVSGDYNRKTGLMGGTGGRLIDSNRNNNADPQNSNHNAVYAISRENTNFPMLGTQAGANGANTMFGAGTRNRTSTNTALTAAVPPCLVGTAREIETEYKRRSNNTSDTVIVSSQTPQDLHLTVFGYSGATAFSSRLAFYSIGEYLDLALLDARVTDLINAFDTAIPS
jgi:hypothetical protein